VCQGFSRHRFNHVATSGDPAHEHRALNGGYAKVSHAIFIGRSGQAA